MHSRMLFAVLPLFSLVACTEPVTGTDASTDVVVNDVVMATDVRDTVIPRDTPPGDPCATDQATATSTLGCNGGWVSGNPAANATGGTCVPGGSALPAGSCTGANNICAAAADAGMGVCIAACTPGSTYVSTGGCPTGFRCFDLGGQGACFRDCDATHTCPTGMRCDNEGSCVD